MDNYKIAVASSDGIVLNQHFGHADIFLIYEVNNDESFRFIEIHTVKSEWVLHCVRNSPE